MPTKPTTAGRTAVPGAAAGASHKRPTPPTGGRPGDAWWKTSLRLLLATLLTGAIPLALAGQILGVWRLTPPGPLVPGFLAPATPTPTLAFAPPRDLWVSGGVDVLPRPGDGAPLARLEAGFPVHLTEWRWRGPAAWARITWAGPTRASGGAGWVGGTALTGYAADTRPLGDLGALAPTVRQAAESGHVAAALYFPDSGRLYLSPTADQPAALGTGLRAVLLADLFAIAAQHGDPVSTSPDSPAARLAGGDPDALDAAYAQLGDAAGVSAYLQGLGVSGFQFKPRQAAGATAAPRALLRFYTALATTDALSAADRQAVLGLLAQAARGTQSGGSAPIAPAALIGAQGALVVGAANACGVLAPSGAPRAIVAAFAGGDSAAAALAAWYAKLADVLA